MDKMKEIGIYCIPSMQLCSHAIMHPCIITSNPKPEVAVLVNSLLWGLRRVFILHINKEYRLIAIFKTTILYNQVFHTLYKTKRTFNTLFKNRRWRPGLKPSWGSFIPLEPKWLVQVSNSLDKQNLYLETFSENNEPKGLDQANQINGEK